MDVKSLIRRRTTCLLLLMILAVVLLTSRLFFLQIWHGKKYTQLAAGQRFRPDVIDPQRGRILDRNLATLAMSIYTDAVYALPNLISDPGTAAKKLAPILQSPEQELIDLLSSTSQSVWLKRKVTPEQTEQIRELGISGIRLQSRPQRFYPRGSLLANVIGIAGVDNQGLEGLEFYYDEYLRGVPGSLAHEKDATQQNIPTGVAELIPPQHGYDLVLTIDAGLQYIAERQLAVAISETGSVGGVIIINNPSTGEILANAVYPSFDPNEYQAYPRQNRRNVPVTDQYEPGSTFKAITMAAALDLGIVAPDTIFPKATTWEVGGGRVHNTTTGTTRGEHTFREALEESDNITFAKISVEMGPDSFYQYIRGFGFGAQTGIDFPGESTGLVPVPGQTRHGETLQWANIGFGQGIAVTPLQMLVALGTIANGGSVIQPHYVAEVRDYNGRLVEERQPTVLKSPIREDTAGLASQLLRAAVSEGTGNRADIAGFRVAGKTGTAEVPEAGGYGDQRISSFMGFAPVDDPKASAIVVLYGPQGEVRYGGVLAAPIFHDVMEATLEHLGVRRSQGAADPSRLVSVPNVRNFPLIEAQVVLAQNNLQWNYYGDGAHVRDQVPAPGSRVPPQSTVNLFFFDGSADKVVEVPRVVGLSMRDSSTILSEAGLRLRIKGSGIATSQIPAAGARVPVGSVIEVEFLP